MIKPENSCLLSELMKNYLESNSRLESSTVSLTRRAFGHLVALNGDMAASEFDNADRFQSWIVDTGREQTTANIWCKTVRPVFRWGVRKGFVEKDPFESLTLFRVARPVVKVFEKEQVEKMLQNASLLWRARILLAKTTGMRKNEVVNLTTADIDFNRGIVAVQPKKETANTWPWRPKDKDIRELPLLPMVGDLLKRLMSNLLDGQVYVCISPRRWMTLRRLKENNKLTDRVRKSPDENFGRDFDSILTRSLIVGLTFHDLRRTCITEWLEGGLQPHQVMRLAGHSSIETTLRFYTAVRKNLLELASKASELAMGTYGTSG